MGHWIELARLDVKFESILQHAEITYGKEYAVQLEKEYKSSRAEEREEKLQSYAKKEVQKATPAMYGNSKSYQEKQKKFQNK